MKSFEHASPTVVSMDVEARAEELWKPVAGYFGRYEISNRGRVRSNLSDIIMQPIYSSPPGYPSVCLSFDGTRRRFFIHHLVWDAFGDGIYNRSDHDLVMTHIDGDKANNAVENLRLETLREMSSHKVNNNKNVGVNRYRGKWMSRILVKRKHLFLGVFETEEEAKIAYDEALPT